MSTLADINFEAIDAVLNQPADAVLSRLNNSTVRNKRLELQAILDRVDLSLETVVYNLAQLVNGSAKEQVKLAAIEVALKLHEVLPLPEPSSTNQIQINVVGDQTQLLSVLAPQRT